MFMGIPLAGGMLCEDLPAQIERYAFSDAIDAPIVRARHGDSSGVRGAAWLWPADGT
jgi:fructokinase